MNNYRLKVILSSLGVVTLICAFFYAPQIMTDSMKRSLNICASTIIPSLFPFAVLSDFLIRSELGNIIGARLSKLTGWLFHLPGCTSCVILMSMVGGFPVGAKMTEQLLENGNINGNQARRLLIFCVNAGPAFVIGAVGSAMLSSKRAGIILYASLCAASLAVGFCSRFFSEGETARQEVGSAVFRGRVFIDSVAHGTGTVINICAWILAFSCVSGYASVLPFGDNAACWLAIASEVTGGCLAAAERFPACVLALVLGWSGLAVHCQILPCIEKAGLSMRRFWVFRLINGGLASFIAYGLFRVFPCEVRVFSSASELLVKPYSVSYTAAVMMLILGASAVLETELARRKKL